MKVKYIITVIGLSLILSGCTKNEKTNISTIDDNSNEIIEVNINEVEKNEKNEQIMNYFSDTSEIIYSFESQTISSDNITVNYPVLSEYKGELSKQYINDSIESFAAGVAQKYSDLKGLTFSYDITKQSDYLFCIKLTSDQSENEALYTEALIIDLDSTNTITQDILFLGSQDAVSDLITKHYSSESETVFDVSKVIMVLEGDNMIFISKGKDGLSDESTFSVPVKDLVDFMNINFGEHPAS